MPVVDGRDVPFREAIGFLRDKIELPTETWTDLWQGMHARAFVVAGARDADLVADFHEAVRRGLEDGTTLEAFREDFDRIVARHGWSYRGGRGWRSRVIFETNLRTAYQAGRWRQIQEVKEDRPWLRYVAVRDARTRPDHAAWHGAVLHADDPWWRTHYPPNGWGCRCIVQQLSGDDLEAFGYAASAGAPRVEWESRTVNTPDGEVALRVPRGIDTGWAYNVGEAGFGRGAGLIAQERHGKWQGLFAPGGSRPADPGRLAAAEPVGRGAPRGPRGDEAARRERLREAIGGDKAVFADPAGARVAVDQALVDHMLEDARRQDGREAYFPLIPELIERPQEIWVGFAESEASRRVTVRRRYVRLVRVGRSRVFGLVADIDGGDWAGLTFFRGQTSALRNLRTGLRVYSDGGTGGS